MARDTFTKLVILLGLPLFIISYLPSNNRFVQQKINLPKHQNSLKVTSLNEKAFEIVSRLAEDKKYLRAIERLEIIPRNSSYYKEAKEIKSQYWIKVIETLGACSYGFDSEALGYSTFHKLVEGKYVAEIKCYSGEFQPAYEYYLYTESAPVVEAKPLNLLRFEQIQNEIVKKDSNFVTGEPRFDRSTQELVVLQKYGDTNDCGTLGRYKFERDEFVLKQFLADFKCGDRKLQYKEIYLHNVSLKKIDIKSHQPA